MFEEEEATNLLSALDNNLTNYNPFDPLSVAGFFDSDFMFNIKDGFDIVIGNPPYVRADSGEKHLDVRNRILDSKKYETLWEKWDLYVAFMEQGFNLLKKGGVVTYIIPSAYLSAKYSEKSRKFFIEKSSICKIDFLMDLDIFEAVVKNIIFLFSKTDNSKNIPLRAKHIEKFGNIKLLETDTQTILGNNIFNEDIKQEIKFDNCQKWENIFYVSVGLVLQSNENIAKGLFVKNDLISDSKSEIFKKPYIEGKNIKAYKIEKIRYLEWDTDRCPKMIRRPTFPELYIYPKIVMGGMTSAIFDDNGLIANHSATISSFWHNLSTVDNRSINNSVAKDFNVKGKSLVIKKRRELKNISKQFNIKYCLAILNSKFAKWVLNQVRRSAIGFYPDDLKEIPIKQIAIDEQKPFEILVDKIMELKKVDSHVKHENDEVRELEKQIDEMVYKLYGLSEDEIKVVEGRE